MTPKQAWPQASHQLNPALYTQTVDQRYSASRLNRFSSSECSLLNNSFGALHCQKTSTMSACVICKSNDTGHQHALECDACGIRCHRKCQSGTALLSNERMVRGRKGQGTWNESSRERTVQERMVRGGKGLQGLSFSGTKVPGN